MCLTPRTDHSFLITSSFILFVWICADTWIFLPVLNYSSILFVYIVKHVLILVKGLAFSDYVGHKFFSYSLFLCNMCFENMFGLFSCNVASVLKIALI